MSSSLTPVIVTGVLGLVVAVPPTLLAIYHIHQQTQTQDTSADVEANAVELAVVTPPNTPVDERPDEDLRIVASLNNPVDDRPDEELRVEGTEGAAMR